MDAAAFAAAYNGLKFAKDSLGALVDAKVAIEAQGKILEVLSKLGDVQDALFELRNELLGQQEQNANLRQNIEPTGQARFRCKGAARSASRAQTPVVGATKAAPMDPTLGRSLSHSARQRTDGNSKLCQRLSPMGGRFVPGMQLMSSLINLRSGRNTDHEHRL